MAVVNVQLPRSFSEEGINKFLRDLSYGRGHTAPIKGQIHTIEPWDGKGGQLPEKEENYLSDVDLDEKDEMQLSGAAGTAAISSASYTTCTEKTVDALHSIQI